MLTELELQLKADTRTIVLIILIINNYILIDDLGENNYNAFSPIGSISIKLQHS